MNVDRIEKLIDRLKRVERENPEAFNMDDWFSMQDEDGVFAETAWVSGNIKGLDDNYCGTVGCIAGWALALFWDELTPDQIVSPGGSHTSPRVDIPATAGKLLGLDDDQAKYLFLGYWTDEVLAEVPVAAAIEELEFMLEDAQQFDHLVDRYRTDDANYEGGFHP